MDDKKSWFTWMEVLDLIYHQFFFTANHLGRQPISSQFFQSLARFTLLVAATAIHGVLSQYATGKNVAVMFSQDEYWGKFCPSLVIDFIPTESTALMNYILVGFILPPWCSSGMIGVSQPPLALYSLDWCFYISLHAPYPPPPPPWFVTPPLRRAFLNHPWCTSTSIGSSLILFRTRYTRSALLYSDGCCSTA